tara:strand:+ start:915 stop:1658 length:744 start_codon:yes stop_codon:yes gene_type:complete
MSDYNPSKEREQAFIDREAFLKRINEDNVGLIAPTAPTPMAPRPKPRPTSLLESIEAKKVPTSPPPMAPRSKPFNWNTGASSREDFKEALVSKETGGSKSNLGKNTNYIFTYGSENSSAFGPAQITKTLAKDIKQRNKNNLKTQSKSFKKYLDNFINQGQERLDAYQQLNIDYFSSAIPLALQGGGEGIISNKDHKKHYSTLFDLALDLKIKKGDSPKTVAKKWYGSNNNQENEDYAKDVVRRISRR